MGGTLGVHDPNSKPSRCIEDACMAGPRQNHIELSRRTEPPIGAQSRATTNGPTAPFSMATAHFNCKHPGFGKPGEGGGGSCTYAQ